MRFTNFLFALPLIGSVLAAPIAKTEVAKRDVDVLAAATALVNVVKTTAGSITTTSVEADVTAALNVVIGGLNDCGSALGIDLSVNLDVNASVAALTKRDSNATDEVSQLLATVVQDVNGLVSQIADDVASIPAVSALISQIDNSLGLVLQGVEAILAGVLSLVAGILSDLGITLAPVLSGVLGLLTNLVGGLLGSL